MSRETRRLLAAAGLALVTLWLLARVRYPEAAVAPNPVPPLLAQLAPPAGFADLAAEVSAAATIVDDALTTVGIGEGEGPRALALRVRSGLAVVLAPLGTATSPAVANAVAFDRASGLLLVRTEEVGTVARAEPSSAAPGNTPEYLFAAVPTASGAIALRPVLATAWTALPSPIWETDVWSVAPGPALTPGSFLFTAAGELAGAVSSATADIVIPGAAIFAAADRLMAVATQEAAGWIGVEVAALRGRLAAATGADRGVIITSIDPSSPAAGRLHPGDVVTTIDDRPIASVDDWTAVIQRLRVNEVVRLLTSTSDTVVDVTAIAPPVPPAGFGARLRRTGGRTEVVSVEPGSAASIGGLSAGDVIVRAGSIHEPTPTQVENAFAMRANVPLLVVVMRAGASHVLAVGS